MAIHAHSTTVSAVQPRLLRGGGTVPCRVLTSAEVVALVADHPRVSGQIEPKLNTLADTAQSEGRTGSLPPVLPSLASAFSRRRAIFGAVAIAAAPAAMLATRAEASPFLSTNDRRLSAIAAELLEIDTQANALDEDAPGYDALIDRYTPLEAEMEATPADTLAGVLAKAQTLQIIAVAHCQNAIGNSIAADLRRLHAAGRLAHG